MPKANIVEELCVLLGFAGSGRLTKVANAFAVTRQVVNGWKVRNKLPETQYAKASELTGKPIEYFLKWRSHSTVTVPMSDFVSDLPRFVQLARDGGLVLVTVHGKPVIQVAPAPAV